MGGRDILRRAGYGVGSEPKTKRWERVRTITVITEPEPEKPGVRLGIGKEEVTAVKFIPPEEVDSIRLEAKGRFESDFRSVDGIHGRFTFIPDRPLTCELRREAIGKVLRCWQV